MKFSTVLFDLDGTLVDSISLILDSYRYALEQMGIEAQDQEILDTIGIPLKEACSGFAGARGEELLKCYIDYQETIHDQRIKEYTGTSSLLKLLSSRGYRLGVVTSKRKVMAKRGIEVVGLDKYVEVLVAFEDTVAHKPDPEPVEKALQALGVTAKESIYVGDSIYDIRSGKNAGVATAGVTWGVSSEEDMLQEGPDVIVCDWGDLLTFLDGASYASSSHK